MKNTILIPLFAILSSLVFSGCGVMFGGARFNGSILVKDNPEAKIYVNGNQIGRGAAIGSFPRNQPLTVQLKKDGCETKTQTFNKTFRGGNFVLSLFMWGLVGIAIDLGTGASFKPDHTHDPAIQKEDFKNFTFNMTYEGCPNN